MKRLVTLLLSGFLCAPSARTALAELHVLVDQVGYERTASKEALVVGTAQDHCEHFALVDVVTGKTVQAGKLTASGDVLSWGDRHFWTADFSALQTPGQYEIRIETPGGDAHSSTFEINDDLLERNTLSNVIFYFKGQRSSGLIDEADRHLPLPGGKGETVDVHGGWYDATGDYGIHLSHQNPTNYFNPQQVPLVVWSLLKSYLALGDRHDDNFTEYQRRLLDEGLYGADFLVRMQRPGGSFFETISGQGPAKLPKDREIGNPNWKTQIKLKDTDSTMSVAQAVGPHAYEAGFRSGGGMAIAALALASTMPAEGEYSHAVYLAKAKEAFEFLNHHNRELLDDGKENILDDYCALMAATELYRATRKPIYKTHAASRARSLMARLTTAGKYRDFWRADAGDRPYFHPSDAGLPLISLIEYDSIAAPAERVQVHQVIERSFKFELSITSEVNNPFAYARQLVRMGDGTVRTAFFFPHDTEASPWWQGENARIASLAAAARMAMPLFIEDKDFHQQLQDYAWHQMHWILGRNPFDTSMLMGSGHGNAPYMFFRSYKYTSPPGGIVNGTTAGLSNEDGIAWNEGFAVTGKDEDWRWTETWLPHAAWYLYSVCLPHS